MEIDQSKFGAVYIAGNGEERTCFNLPRLECDLVVSGYSAKYRLAIITRWHELEIAELTGKRNDNVLKILDAYLMKQE